jgi:hypothetical protein
LPQEALSLPLHQGALDVSTPHRIATLVKTVIIDPIPIVNGNDINLRVEIFSWSVNEYSCQVSRIDRYRVKPTFHDDVADERFLVLDEGIEWDELRADTADGLLDLLFDKMEWQWGVKIDRPAPPPGGQGSP